MKKSFILHIDSLGILDELNDEQCGQLFRLISSYHNPNKPKQTEITQVVNLAFYQFKSQFDRDLQTYNNVVERNKINGTLGGRPKNKNPKKPKKADSDNDSDSDSKNDSNKDNNIDERKLKFSSTLTPFLQTYGKDMLNDFYKYWTEPNKSNTKFKQELEKTWSLERRLETWSKNDFNKSKSTPIINKTINPEWIP